jgi:hypothetical protein
MICTERGAVVISVLATCLLTQPFVSSRKADLVDHLEGENVNAFDSLPCV